MNPSLLTTKNDSLFHHSFDTPSFAVECSKMFYSKSFQHVWNTVWVNFFAFFIRISPGELWGMGSVIQHKNWNEELTQPTYFFQYNYSYSIYYGDSQRFTAIGQRHPVCEFKKHDKPRHETSYWVSIHYTERSVIKLRHFVHYAKRLKMSVIKLNVILQYLEVYLTCPDFLPIKSPIQKPFTLKMSLNGLFMFRLQFTPKCRMFWLKRKEPVLIGWSVLLLEHLHDRLNVMNFVRKMSNDNLKAMMQEVLVFPSLRSKKGWGTYLYSGILYR